MGMDNRVGIDCGWWVGRAGEINGGELGQL